MEKGTLAALPFLSFAAGLMTAAEVPKLTVPGSPYSAERVMLGLKGQLLLVGTPIPHRTGCLYESRHMGVHQAAIAGSRYAEFAGYGRRYDDRGILIGGKQPFEA